MAETWVNFTNLLRTLWTGDDSDEESPTPLMLRQKRRAISPPQANQVSHPKRPRLSFTNEEYANADLFEGAAERRTSYAGINTLVQESGTESEIEAQAGRRASGYHLINQPRRPSKVSTSAKTASAQRVRQGRLSFFKGLGFNVGSAVDQIQEVIEQADEAGLIEEFPALDHALDDLEHAKEDLEHARDDVEEVQAQIEEGITAAPRPSHEDEPAPLPEYEPQDEVELPAPASVPATTQTFRCSSKIDDEWQTTPNKRARHIARSMKSDAAKAKILSEIHEPEYSIRDIEVRDMMWQIMDKMERFARKFYNFELRSMQDIKRVLEGLEHETVKIIGCVASGGPGGEDGWIELFTDSQKRRALICAIIGNVLIEQVFKYPCFGAEQRIVEELAHVQRDLKDEDGFARTERYASVLQPHLFLNNASTLVLPPNFHRHVKAIVSAISIHTLPLSFIHIDTVSSNPDFLTDLTDIVSTAGLLSLQMRADPHTVWYFPPTFKEDTFQRKHMECFNRIAMEKTHPREPSTIWPLNTTDAEKKRAQNDEPLTQITIMDGITAYRKGGWETEHSTIWQPEFADEGFEEKGIRARILVHGWVYCRWGRPRKFADKGSDDEAKVHGFRWRAPGFLEFGDVVEGWKKRRDGRRKSSGAGSVGSKRSGRASTVKA